MINYKENFDYAQYWRNSIIPHLYNHFDSPIPFSIYLEGFYFNKHKAAFGLPSPYIYNLTDFLKKYEDKCVNFMYNSPEEISRGSSPVSAIYQVNPQLHILGHIFSWIELGKPDGHMTCYIVYEKKEDMLKFLDDNLDIVKKTGEEHKTGFAGFAQTNNK